MTSESRTLFVPASSVVSHPSAEAQPAAAPVVRPRARAALAPRWVAISVYRGCNVYHDRTVVSAVIDLGVLDRLTSVSAGPDFASSFVERFFDAAQTPPTAPANEAFIQALRSTDGVPLAQVLLEAIVALERRLAFVRRDFAPIGMSTVERIGSRRTPRRARLDWESAYPGQSRATAKLALAGLLALLPDSLDPMRSNEQGEPLDFAVEWAARLRRASRHNAPMTTSVIALAANRRGIPYEPIRGPHLQLGHGAAQCMVYSSVPPGATLAATQLSRNKRKTSRRLAQVGLPVTKQIAVASAEQAQAAAAKLGYPVVVKPRKGKKAGGVTVGVARSEEIPGAFERARADGSGVLVEEFVQGATYRLLVIGGHFVAALHVVVPTVIGDGIRRIDELIEVLNRDPMRNMVWLDKVVIDDDLRDCLARGGWTLADVPPAGAEIALRTAANVASGGIHTDATDEVHASHRTLAERAAAALDLSVAGIDIISLDIRRPYEQAGCKILEVNARPGLSMHTFPRHGPARDVAGSMLELLFPEGVTGRIPTALIIGREGASATARELDVLLRERGHTTGLITPQTARIADQPLASEHASLRRALGIMRSDRRVQRLVVAMTPRRAVERGTVLESADAVALLSPEPEDASLYTQAVALAVRVARGALVVDAGNELALQLLEPMLKRGVLERERLILVGTPVQERIIAAHVASGGTAMLVVTSKQGEAFTVRRGEETSRVPGRQNAPERSPGRKTRLRAVALSWALQASATRLQCAHEHNPPG